MSGSATKILVIEDEPPIRRLLRTSLLSQGFEVVEAATGRESLEAIEQTQPDLVILDLGLPDIQGDGVIRTVRALGNSVPILVLSSRADEKGKVEALDLGADDYVTKPFGADELFARIRAALRHRLQQQGQQPVFISGDLKVDLVRRIVIARDEEVKLSPRSTTSCERSSRMPGRSSHIACCSMRSGAAKRMSSICGSTFDSSDRSSRPTRNSQSIS